MRLAIFYFTSVVKAEISEDMTNVCSLFMSKDHYFRKQTTNFLIFNNICKKK